LPLSDQSIKELRALLLVETARTLLDDAFAALERQGLEVDRANNAWRQLPMDWLAEPGTLVVSRNADEQRDVSIKLVRLLDRKMDAFPCLVKLWQEALEAAVDEPILKDREAARTAYKQQLRRFLHRLTQWDTDTATEARAVFEAAGFKFLVDEGGRRLRLMPILNLPDVEATLGSAAPKELRLSGQHLRMICDNPQAALQPSNIVFQLARDNIQMDAGPYRLSRTKVILSGAYDEGRQR
jgi:hypothetical protein